MLGRTGTQPPRLLISLCLTPAPNTSHLHGMPVKTSDTHTSPTPQPVALVYPPTFPTPSSHLQIVLVRALRRLRHEALAMHLVCPLGGQACSHMCGRVCEGGEAGVWVIWRAGLCNQMWPCVQRMRARIVGCLAIRPVQSSVTVCEKGKGQECGCVEAYQPCSGQKRSHKASFICRLGGGARGKPRVVRSRKDSIIDRDRMVLRASDSHFLPHLPAPARHAACPNPTHLPGAASAAAGTCVQRGGCRTTASARCGSCSSTHGQSCGSRTLPQNEVCPEPSLQAQSLCGESVSRGASRVAKAWRLGAKLWLFEPATSGSCPEPF